LLVSRDSAHEITQIKPTIYKHSVSHGLNVDNKIEKSCKKVKKRQKKQSFDSAQDEERQETGDRIQNSNIDNQETVFISVNQCLKKNRDYFLDRIYKIYTEKEL